MKEQRGGVVATVTQSQTSKSVHSGEVSAFRDLVCVVAEWMSNAVKRRQRFWLDNCQSDACRPEGVSEGMGLAISQLGANHPEDVGCKEF